MIGLSPLSTAHPRLFQQTLVRTSTRCYPCFILAMDRSLGFVSKSYDYTRYSHSLSLRLRNVCPLTLPYNLTRWLIMQKARRQPFPYNGHRPPTVCKLLVSGSISLPLLGFFLPFPRGTGSLSVINEYLALEGGPSRFRPGFTCPDLLRYQSHRHYLFAYGAITLFHLPFQVVLLSLWSALLTGPTTPRIKFLV